MSKPPAGCGDARCGGPRIVYDTTSGLVAYDADGYGGTIAVAFARHNPGTTLTAADFEVI